MHKNAALWGALFVLGIGLFFLIYSLEYPLRSNIGPGPGMIPFAVSFIVIVLSLILLYQAIRRPLYIRDVLPKSEGAKKIAMVLVSAVVYLVVVPYTGFVIASAILLFILYVRHYRWYVSVGLAVGVSLLSFWVFDILLKIPLPVNGLGW